MTTTDEMWAAAHEHFDAKAAVERELKEAGQQGRLMLNHQAPSWPRYERALPVLWELLEEWATHPLVEREEREREVSRTFGLTIERIQLLSQMRANRWHGGDFRNWSGLEWAGAMCGEAGEAANVAKKLRRVELGMDGNARSERPLNTGDLIVKLASECADTLLYTALLCSRYDIDLSAAVVRVFNEKSETMGFPERL